VASSPLNLGGLMQEPEFIGIQIRFDTLVILVFKGYTLGGVSVS
jgi:hypothetical protein